MQTQAPGASGAPRFLQGSVQRQTRLLLWAGFGGLLFLMCLLGGSAVSFLYQVEIRQNRIRQDYIERDRILQRLRANLYSSGTHVRDFLLDNKEPPSSAHRQQFFEKQQRIGLDIAGYDRIIRSSRAPALEELRRELPAYLSVMSSVFEWTPQERHAAGYSFVEQEVLPKRLLLLGLVDRIQQLSERQSESSSKAVGELLSSFRLKLAILLVLSVSVGVVLAGITLWRILQLEKDSRRLSADLLAAQENERRRISRELHDEVGQVLYATMLGLENLRSSLHENEKEESLKQLELVHEMSRRTVTVVRNISLLLRPTMLDDLGLVAALKWLAREVTRTCSIQVDVFSDEFPEDLPEEHRTCVYRVVQESLRNASRHSGARQIRVDLSDSESRLRIAVQDDGKGFDARREMGVGILGMEERVVRLGGVFTIESELGSGTTVRFQLPLPQHLLLNESLAHRV